jgi:hypothetical protein
LLRNDRGPDKKLKEIEAKLAAERKKETQAKPGEKVGTRKVVPNLAQPRAAKRAAETVGLKRSTAEKGLAILNRAEGPRPIRGRRKSRRQSRGCQIGARE